MRLVWPHFWIVFVMITLPLAIEHEVVVLIKDLVPHERVFLVFVTNFVLGLAFGVALGLVEVSLAERLVTRGARTGRHVRSEDVELPGGAATAWDRPSGAAPRRHPNRNRIEPADRRNGAQSEHRGGRVTMEETIHGTTMPVLELSLQPGEAVVSEAGEFSWMSDAVQMATNTGGGMGGKGLMGAVKRAVSAPPS